MKRPEYIKRIEGNGSPSSLRKPDGSRISTFGHDGTDIDVITSGTDIILKGNGEK